MSSELQGIDRAIDDALAQIPAVEVVAHVTGHFVGLMKELVRRNGKDPEKRMIINAGDQRSITIHKLGEGQEQADAALADAQQALGTARAMVASLTAELAAVRANQAQAEPIPPVLVRDLAELLGSDVPTVCTALVALGRQPRSTNMAVGGEEALAVAAMLAAAPKGGA